MGLFSRDKPKIKVQTTKKDGFSGWLKCIHCSELIHANELENHQNCCPKCDYHYRLSVNARIQSLCDEDSFHPLFNSLQPVDALNFIDTEAYLSRLAAAKEKSESNEAVVVGTGFLNQLEIALAVLDFSFMGGSMGSVVGERLTLLIELALEKKLPFVCKSLFYL